MDKSSQFEIGKQSSDSSRFVVFTYAQLPFGKGYESHILNRDMG